VRSHSGYPDGLSRRGFLSGALGTATVAGAGTALAGCDRSGGTSPAVAAARIVPFRGEHQAGIVTPAQDRLVFAAFDVSTADRVELVRLLQRWTAAAERMTAGEPVGSLASSAGQVPQDTGEALGLGPSRLSVTVGFGPKLFDHRFGLSRSRPSSLADLPPFAGDVLDRDRSGGDLCIQACADDPQVAFHAVRNLSRLGLGTVTLRWMQLGFGRTSSTSDTQQTPRNLLGFKDGTRNLVAEDAAEVRQHLWVSADQGPPWLVGGSYLVARRIRMAVETWDRESIGDQQAVFGRAKVSGAPLTGSAEHDQPNLAAIAPDGRPVIAADAHIRLAAPESNAGVRILRRGYSFTDGVDPRTGQLDAGLFFVCFQADPATGFIPVQRRLATDALNEYVKHTSSALFACPPGVGPGDYWGRQLFG
jgi:deferrochelatase/peroxidase EfeB